MPNIELEPIEFGGTLDPLYSALLIQLALKGILKPDDLDAIALRLDAEGESEDADSVRMLGLDIAIERDFLDSKDGTDGANATE